MKMKILLLTMVIASLVMASFTGLNAKTIYYVKVNGTGNGSSWSSAAGNIQDMIDKAVAGDEVWVAEGYYFSSTQNLNDTRLGTFLMKNGVNLYGGFSGNETNIEDRAFSDWDDNGKIEPWELTHVTYLNGNDYTPDTRTRITYSVGNTSTWRWSISGTEYNSNIVVTCPSDIVSETIIDGFCVVCGTEAGIHTLGKTKIQNCYVYFNAGTGIYNDIGIVTNSAICGNSGSGIINSGSVINCLISDNTFYALNSRSGSGGGIRNYGGDVINCTIYNNQLLVYYINSSNISPNNIMAYGGGIYNSGGKIDRCLIMANSSYSYNGATGGAGLSAYSFGGGIYDSGGIISNCCIFNNQVLASKTSTYFTATTQAVGGGFYGDDSNPKYYNSTVINNSNGNSLSSGTNGINNLMLGTTVLSENFIRPTSFIGRATTEQRVAELLQADWHLKAGSQYIDAGTLTDLPDWVINGTDLAGKPRTHNGKISVGAYEYDPSYTNINELQASDVAVFPNPATDNITVSGLQNNETIRLYNINGQSILTRKAAGETETIAIGNLPAGIYFVKTEMGKTLKWVKK